MQVGPETPERVQGRPGAIGAAGSPSSASAALEETLADGGICFVTSCRYLPLWEGKVSLAFAAPISCGSGAWSPGPAWE